jgi:hypothetical protein
VTFSKNFNRIGEYCGSFKITKWRIRVEAQDSPEDMQKVSGGLYALSQKLAIGPYPKQASSFHSFPNYFFKIVRRYLGTMHRPSISSPPMRFCNRMKFSFLSVCYISYPYYLSIYIRFSGLKLWVKDATREVYDTCFKTNVTLKSEKRENFATTLKTVAKRHYGL